MKRRTINNILGILLLSLSYWMMGCGNSNSAANNPTTPNASTTALSLGASIASIRINGTDQFTASGGTAPYVYSVVSGGGIINSSTGSYSAPSLASSVDVRVTDSTGTTADLTITVTTSSTTTTGSTLTITPAVSSVNINNTVLFSVTGGITPYTFSIVTGGGSIGASSGILTAPSSTGYVEVQATDAAGTTGNYTISVIGSSSSSTVVSCAGTYTINANGVVGTLTILEDSNSGNIAGSLQYGSSIYSISGSCSLALTGSISFTRLGSTQVYNGTFYVNSNQTTQVLMTGTFANKPTDKQVPWFAVPN